MAELPMIPDALRRADQGSHRQAQADIKEPLAEHGSVEFRLRHGSEGDWRSYCSTWPDGVSRSCWGSWRRWSIFASDRKTPVAVFDTAIVGGTSLPTAAGPPLIIRGRLSWWMRASPRWRASFWTVAMSRDGGIGRGTVGSADLSGRTSRGRHADDRYLATMNAFTVIGRAVHPLSTGNAP